MEYRQINTYTKTEFELPKLKLTQQKSLTCEKQQKSTNP